MTSLERAAVALAAAVWACACVAGPLEVSLVQERDAVQMRMRSPAGEEPSISWPGTSRPPPYRLVLIWDGPPVTLTRPLPVVPPEGVGPVQSMVLHTTSDRARLEVMISRAVTPKLRRAGDSWILELDPAAPAVASAPAVPAAVRTPDSQNDKAEVLLVDVQVNGQALPGIISVLRLPDGRLLMPATAWQAARLRTPAEALPLADGERGYALEAAGLTYGIDRAQLKLAITAPALAFDGTQLSVADQTRAAIAPPVPGAYLNYDFSLVRGEAGNSFGGLLEGIAFNTWGAFVHGTAVTDDGSGLRSVRTESYWRRDLPGSMETLVIGDTVAGGNGWSRPARYGGVRWSRDFSLAPGYITTPMPTVAGSAALPSTVDVLLNNRPQSTTSVPPGPFALTNVPVVNGAGELNVVVRDLRGVETVISQSYYTAQTLLSPGLSDFSLEAGALRRDFGRESDNYGPGFAAGSLRLGVTSEVTAGGRVELQRTRQAAGAEAAGLLGTFAVAHAAVAWSRTSAEDPSGQGSGVHWLAGVDRVAPGGGVSVQWEHFGEGFRQFAAVAGEHRPRNRINAGGGMRLGDGLSIGASYTRQTTWDGNNAALAAVSVGMKLPADAYLSLYASKQLGTGHGWGAGLSLIMPLGPLTIASASSNRNPDGTRSTAVQASKAAPQGPGAGWSVRASDTPSQAAQGKLTLNTNTAQLLAEVNAGKDNNAVRVGANGSIGWLDGYAFAARRIDHGAFAVVNVGDVEGVEVMRSNQVVARTDSRGMALVTGLLPYEKNQLTVNGDALPLDVEVRGVREVITPFARSGVRVDFPVSRALNALLILHRPDGTVVASGTRVTVMPGAREFIVAKRGEVYLMDLQLKNTIEVHGPGLGCSFPVDLDTVTTAQGEARLGPVVCGGSQ